MSVVYIALPAVLLLVLAGVIAFIWAVRSGQMDDLDTPGLRILGDDDEPPPSPPNAECGMRNAENHPDESS
jgi:cbb3-type cytochrome oxidase maturation protein